MTRMQRDMTRAVILALHDNRMTRSDLAARTGYTAGYISRLLNGGIVGTLPAWQSILDALGITVEVHPPR